MFKRLFKFACLGMVTALPATAAMVDVNQPTVRAMPPGVPNTAGYLQLTADADDALLGANCDGVERTEIHTLLMENGLMKMRPISRLALPQDTTVSLEQGGYHLMMMGLSTSPKVGDSLTCTLQFEQTKPQLVTFAVKRIDQPQEHQHHHHH